MVNKNNNLIPKASLRFEEKIKPMKSIIALEEIEQFSSGLMGKNHEEGTEERIGKAFEVAGIVPCVVV